MDAYGVSQSSILNYHSLTYCPKQRCIENVYAQAFDSAIGCPTLASSCLCKSMTFWYGIRDCSQQGCGRIVYSQVAKWKDNILCSRKEPVPTTPRFSNTPSPTPVDATPIVPTAIEPTPIDALGESSSSPQVSTQKSLVWVENGIPLTMILPKKFLSQEKV